MSFSEISISGSDLAQEIEQKISKAIFLILLEELGNLADPDNTPGCVNVALLFEERLSCFSKSKNKDLNYLASKTLQSLTYHYKESSNLDWEDEDSKKIFLNGVERLIRSLQKFIESSSEDLEKD